MHVGPPRQWSAPIRARSIREYVIHALLLAVLLVPVFPDVFLRGEVAFPANVIYLYAPWRAHMPPDLEPQNMVLETPRQANAWYYLTAKAMCEGEWPLWNPYQFMGVPLIGSYQTAIFYPPRLMFLLIDDLYVAFTLFILSKLWLGGMLAYVCARYVSLPPAYARFVSIAYMFGGYMITWCSYTTVDSMAWAPLLYTGLEMLVEGRWRRGFAASFVSATMMAFAAGAQHTLTFSLMLGLYFLVRLAALRSPAHALRAIGTAAGAGGAALLVTSIQILPFVETLRLSESVLDTVFKDSASNYYLSPLDIPVLWTPAYFGTNLHGNYWGRMNALYVMMAYIGVACWLGAALSFRGEGFTPVARARVRALQVTSVAAMWFAFSLPGAALVLSLPLFDKVRLIYFLSFFIFGVPLFTAFALQRWYESRAEFRQFVPAALLATIIVVITIVHLWSSGPELAEHDRAMTAHGTLLKDLLVDSKAGVPLEPMDGGLDGYVWKQVFWTIGMLALSLACLALAFAQRFRRFGIIAISGALAIDLLSAWHGMQPTSPRSHVFPPMPLFEEIQQRGHPYRVSVLELVASALPIVYDIEESEGYDTIVPRRYAKVLIDQLTPSGRAAFEPALATPCYFFPAPRAGEAKVPPGYEIEFVRDDVIVAKNTRALPRARLVGGVERHDSVESMLARINSTNFDPTNLALVEGEDAPPNRTSAGGPPGEARVTRWDWNGVDVEFEATEDAVLVLAESYYPGWEATLDQSTPLSIFPVYHLMRGVEAPAGRHTVSFRYRPPLFRMGAWLSVASLAGMLACATAVLYKGAAKRRATRCISNP
ncbi:MAG: YfhO family protein [Candidatus Hydrogenedentes bacterium]|nr:YfhO family protein [Candidatus Hydrogenedentota bacterium]